VCIRGGPLLAAREMPWTVYPAFSRISVVGPNDSGPCQAPGTMMKSGLEVIMGIRYEEEFVIKTG